MSQVEPAHQAQPFYHLPHPVCAGVMEPTKKGRLETWLFQLQKGRREKGSVNKTDRERGKKGKADEKTWHRFWRCKPNREAHWRPRLENHELEASIGVRCTAGLCNKITNLQTSEKQRRDRLGWGRLLHFQLSDTTLATVTGPRLLLSRALQLEGIPRLFRPGAAKLPFARRFSPHPGFLRPMTSFRSQERSDFSIWNSGSFEL